MINKLYKLRKYIPENSIETSPYGLCLEERKEKVIVLEFVSLENDLVFKCSHLETYSSEKNKEKFFFKKVSANGTSDFPTIFISRSDFVKSTKKLIKILKKTDELNPLLTALDKFCYKIKRSFLNKIESEKKNNELYILTITIDGKYIGELNLFDKIREKLKGNLFEQYYTINKKEIKTLDKVCSICLSNNKEVWGYVSTFNFYAAKTELAPIAGGFDKTKSWKNYPVCSSCAIQLKEAKSFLEKKMKYNFCGFSYFIIPDFINMDEANREIMEIFLDKESLTGKFSLNNNIRNTITNTEEEVFDILKETDNIVNYTLFFFEENNQEFKVLLTIEDVYPSQFKEVFNAKEDAEKSNIFKNIKNKKENTFYDLQFKFDFVKEFIPVKSKKYGNFSKQFLDIVRSVFLQKKIDYNFIMHRIAESFKRKFANDELYYVSVLKTILTLKFFNKLGIIDMSTKFNEKEVIVDAKYQDFFSNHSDFFDCSSKKAVFLEGVLCQKLLNIQKYERNATPFRSKLNSLKLNPKIIQKLLPEIIEKLEQYGKNYYYNLEETISKLLLESKLDKLSNDEISFYFVMGMNLYKEILPPSEKDEEDNQK